MYRETYDPIFKELAQFNHSVRMLSYALRADVGKHLDTLISPKPCQRRLSQGDTSPCATFTLTTTTPMPIPLPISCPLVVQVSGAESVQSEFMGRFTQTSITSSNQNEYLPIYENSHGKHLYYWAPTARWLIDNNGEHYNNNGYMYSTSIAQCPTQATDWTLWDGNAWVSTYLITIVEPTILWYDSSMGWPRTATFADGAKFCQDHQYSLCTKEQYCPGGSVAGGQKSGDQWVPFAGNGDNAWMQVGTRDTNSPCKSHHQMGWGRPAWGTGTSYQNFRSFIACCK